MCRLAGEMSPAQDLGHLRLLCAADSSNTDLWH
jgi:hypothetical protein